MPLLKAIARLKPNELDEFTFCGVVNNIRHQHPLVTPTYGGVWYQLARAVHRSNGMMRYPQNIQRVRHCCARALLYRYNEQDLDAEDFDLWRWLQTHNEAASIVTDMRAAKTILEPTDDNWSGSSKCATESRRLRSFRGWCA